MLHASLGYFNLPPLLQAINGINFLKDLLKGEELSDDNYGQKECIAYSTSTNRDPIN